MRLRQIALAARDLDAVTDDLSAVLGIEIAFRDPGVKIFGLRNAVMPVGDTFLEVVSPIDPGASAARWLSRRGGDGGYMAIFQTPDLAAERRRLETRGVRVVWEASLDDIAAIHLHPRDVGAAIVSFDEPRPAESWRWAGPWRGHVRNDRVGVLRGAVLQAADPEALAARWGEVLGLPVVRSGSHEEQARIELDGAVLRFVNASDGPGDGLAGIELEAVDAARCLDSARERGLETDGERAVRICGTRIAFV